MSPLTGSLFVSDQRPEILLVDGDRVESRNASRQFFHPSDEGSNKAEVFAEHVSEGSVMV